MPEDSLRLIRPIYLAATLVKALMVYALQSHVDSLKALPFLLTQFQSFDRVEEAVHLIGKGYDPYEFSYIYQVLIPSKLPYPTRRSRSSSTCSTGCATSRSSATHSSSSQTYSSSRSSQAASSSTAR